MDVESGGRRNSKSMKERLLNIGKEPMRDKYVAMKEEKGSTRGKAGGSLERDLRGGKLASHRNKRKDWRGGKPAGRCNMRDFVIFASKTAAHNL